MKIETKQAYYEAMVEIEKLLNKGFDNLSEYEELRLAEMSEAVEVWENLAYPMPIKPSFIEILEYLLKSHNIKKGELAERLGVKPSSITALFNGREPNATILGNLHTNFGLDGNLILESLFTNTESNSQIPA